MANLICIRAKSNARYTCQECGSTELIQGHHEIPSDDASLIILCADCHSKKHPNVPKALFFSKSNQPYWHNKSASSLAKEFGVHPRTILRAAKKLEIQSGELSPWDKELIKKNIPKLNRKPKVKKVKKVKYYPPQITVEVKDLLAPKKAAAYLGVSVMTLWRWVRDNKITPVMLDHTYFHTNELDRIKALYERRSK